MSLKNNFSSWWTNGKCKETLRQQTCNNREKNYLVSESSFQSAKILTENLLAIEMRKTQTFINKPGYLGLLILGLLIFINILLIYY